MSTSRETGPGAAPYLPRRYCFISSGTMCQRRPDSTLSTAWVPTIWLMGVTSGGKPTSARTIGISSSTSGSRSSALCSLSWLSRLLIMPPGTWCE